MASLTLEQSITIARATLERGREAGFKPLTVAVLDDAGVIKVVHRDDGSSLLRPEIAVGKAWGALGMGMSSRAIAELVAERTQFAASLTVLAEGRVVPAAGGVLVRDGSGDIVGAVGVTGDISDNDEEAAIHGIEASGLQAGL
jgi:uncharacterized protein GlcG (DUF336 family)